MQLVLGLVMMLSSKKAKVCQPIMETTKTTNLGGGDCEFALSVSILIFCNLQFENLLLQHMSSRGGTCVRGRVSMMGGPLYTTIDRWERGGG